MKEKAEDGLLDIVRLGGYLVLIGIIVGVGVGVYAVVNLWFFSRFVYISRYEAMGFFLSVNLPSVVIVAALGYIFATTLSLDSDSTWRVSFLSILSLTCMALSALSVFNFISFSGGLLVLIGTILAYTRPTFKALSGKEATFLAEIGFLLVASSATLFLLMWLVSKFLSTYLMGAWGFGALYPSMFLIMAIISFLMFFVTPFLGLRSAHMGACGALNLTMLIVISAIAIVSQYLYLNLSVYLGVLMLIIGIISVLFGALIYIRLSFFRGPPLEAAALEVSVSGFPYYGKYCAYCGTPLAGTSQTFCSRCGRRLAWKPGAPFCRYCGKVVPKEAYTCPHCQETLD